MQQDSVICLAREVERVITSPYTPSLLSLERLVHNISYAGLRQWVDCKPCQVSLLAAVVLEQLPNTTKLLARFAYIREFRDALLDREPLLLDQLLLRAIQGGSDENLNACVAILSCPVPRDIAIPARVPIFLTKLLNNVVENPSSAKIRPLYEAMEGLLSNSDLIKLLPTDLMETFQREGTKILRNLNDPLGTLLSLATFARIRRLWQPASKEGNHDDEPPRWLANICQIFGPKSACKTLDLVIISAVMACSTSTTNQYTPDDRILLVKLAIEICREIDEEHKKTWLSANSAKLAKLCDKLRRPEIEGDLQFMGLALLINFSHWLSLPAEIYQMMRERLFSQTACSMIHDLSEREKETLVERLITHCNNKDNLDVFTYALSALRSNETMDNSFMSRIQLSVLFLSTLNKPTRNSVSQMCLQHLSVEDMENIRAYVRGFSLRDGLARCEESIVCHSAIYACKDRLFLEFLSLVNSETATGRGVDTPEASFHPNELMESFLDSLKENTMKTNCCVYSKLKKPERMSELIYAKTKTTVTINSDGSSREWRSKVASLLLDNAQASHETVLRQMEAICQDFETRCTKVEEPLAIAVQEGEELRRQLEHATQRNLELEEQARQSMELTNKLKKQIEDSTQQVNNYSFQIEHLTDQVDALQTELDDTRKQSQESIEAVRSKARDRELDLMATVAERDDLLEEQQIEIDGISRERAQFKETMDTASEHNRAISHECEALREEMARLQKDAVQERDTLRHEVTKLQQVMDIRESTNVEKDNRIVALSNTNQDLHCENQILKEKLEQEKSNGKALLSTLEEARQNYQTSIADMEARIDEQISQAHKQAQQVSDRHSLEVAGLRKDAAHAAAKFEKDIRAKEKRIQYLEKKVESLRNERAAKAREFGEAQEHISRLMSVMGFTKDSKEEHNSNSNKRRVDATPKTGREIRRSSRLSELQTQSGAPPPSQGEMTPGMQTQVSPPTRQDTTTTATRRRSQRLSGAAVSFANDSSYPFLSDQKEQAVVVVAPRQPLGDVDRNSPIKSSSPNHVKEPGHNNSQVFSRKNNNNDNTDIDITELGDVDLDFDEDELLTSTMAR